MSVSRTQSVMQHGLPRTAFAVVRFTLRFPLEPVLRAQGRTRHKPDFDAGNRSVSTLWPFRSVRQTRSYLRLWAYSVDIKRARRLMRLIGLIPIHQ